MRQPDGAVRATKVKVKMSEDHERSTYLSGESGRLRLRPHCSSLKLLCTVCFAMFLLLLLMLFFFIVLIKRVVEINVCAVFELETAKKKRLSSNGNWKSEKN